MQDPYARHKRDHDLARTLARALAGIDPNAVDADGVQTNIVNCFVDDASGVTLGLRERGVLALGKGRRIRFVTHAQVDEASVDAAIGALAEIMPLRRARRAHA